MNEIFVRRVRHVSLAVALLLGASVGATTTVTLKEKDDGVAVVKATIEALTGPRLFVDHGEKIVHVIGPMELVDFVFPPNMSFDAEAALTKIVHEVIAGKRLEGASHSINLRGNPWQITGSKRVRGTPVPGDADADLWDAHETLLGGRVAAETYGSMPGGQAPHENAYFLVRWDPSLSVGENVDLTMDGLEDRTLATEPSYVKLLGDDRLVPDTHRARFIANVEQRLRAGYLFGIYPMKSVMWRSHAVPSFTFEFAFRWNLHCARLLTNMQSIGTTP